ncbi:MAG: NAD(P)-binding protein [Candidatus Helarchaeota archaeon]|nr:NAD(P)-binding protein [Candidatus Helarchaeota archaeon]
MIGILGAGLAGLSAGYHLKKDYVIFEKDSEIGGLCRSFTKNGYTFDFAPHIFFTKNENVKVLIKKLLGENIITKIRKAFIYIYGRYLEYPFEANLGGLPNKIIDECISTAIKAKENPTEYHNFYEWIENVLGKGVAKHYMIPYNEKIWKYDLRKMHYSWIAGRVPSPKIEEMKKGASGMQNETFGPNATFSYPITGGIGAIPNSFLPHIKNLKCNAEVINIKPRKDEVEITVRENNKEKTYNFEKIFSSIPLPELFKILENVPEEILKISTRLVHNSILFAAIGVDRANITDKHWLYFPEKDYIFHRLSFPMNLSEKTTPPKKSSIMIEVTYPMNETIDIKKTKDQIRLGLIKANLLKEKDKLEVFYTELIKYAYVIYDLNHKENVSKLHEYLIENNIIPVGRFSQWEYINMDITILNGKIQVEKFG